MTLQQAGSVEARREGNTQRRGEGASAVWTRSNNTKQLTSTQVESGGPRSTPPHVLPVAVIEDVETAQGDRQKYNLRSWLMKDAGSTNRKEKNYKARSESA
jgi:hypothetical protein